MSETIHAIYERGVFKPQQPVALPDGQSVRLQVHAVSTQGSTTKTVREILAEAGLLTTLGPGLERRSLYGVNLEAVREALASAGGKPLSEIIIEQRGPRT